MSETPSSDLETRQLEFERERHQAELELKKRELELAHQRHEAELELKKAELQLRRAHDAKLWRNPLVLAIAAGILGLISNAVVAAVNGSMDRDLQHQKNP